jgi:hypothetical protein
MLDIQNRYNKKVLDDYDSLTYNDREIHTQQLALCAHAEISALVNATNFKKHHGNLEKVSRDKILYESIDVLRYVQSIQNLWNISSNEVEEAFYKKDVYLDTRYRIDQNPWSGQPVVIVDMDDVIVEFRKGFASWLTHTFNIEIDVDSPEYYFITALEKLDVNPEHVFRKFMSEGGFSRLESVRDSKVFLEALKEAGCWIHILTARPGENLRCMYDSYYWLHQNSIPFDDISFSSEKFRWCANSKYYNSKSIVCGIDDSPKHASEYAKHGMKCLLPKKSYNTEVVNLDNIIEYRSFINSENSAIFKIKSLLK